MRRDRDCQKTTLAAIGKVGMPSVSGGCSTLDAFFGRADLMLFDRGHANNVFERGLDFVGVSTLKHYRSLSRPPKDTSLCETAKRAIMR